MSGFEITGTEQVLTLRGKLTNAIVGVPQEVRAVNRRYRAIMLETLIQHSSGRPGPQEITGAYNAAYVVEVGDDEMSVGADNPSPQSNRLEEGFVGMDVLGRHYYQPPFPHFRPTLDELESPYATDVGEAFPRWWGK